MSTLARIIREPWFINSLQIAGYAIAATCGLLAAVGAIPNIITGQIGPTLAVTVGTIMIVGGFAGAWAVITGAWGLERIVLWVTGIGYVALLIPTLFFAFTRSSSSIWLVVLLEILAILDNMKRYRRIDWAYLDPAK